MDANHWIEIAAIIVGAAISVCILCNKVTREKGIGPQTRQALALSMLSPIVLVLGIERILSSETIAAIVGGLVGYGIPKSKE
jgi:hypothetical protein